MGISHVPRDLGDESMGLAMPHKLTARESQQHEAVPDSPLAGFLFPSYDCSNPIFGQTLNPLNHQKSPGGSSGGEGALIAGGGSILGIGSDVGGSIRLPSSFCGLCGLKPTAERLR